MRRSTLTLTSLLIIATLAGAGSSYLYWSMYQGAMADNKELQSDLIAARHGGAAGGATLGVSDANGNSLGGSGGDVSPGGSSTSSNQRTMLVKDFGIKFTIPSTLTDLTYAESPPASGVLHLTTKSLSDKYSCASAGILGTLFRYPKGTPLPSSAAQAIKLATAGSYEYFYLHIDKNPCTDKAAIAEVNQITPQMVAALKTIAEQE